MGVWKPEGQTGNGTLEKITKQSYRLLYFQSTSPEELYEKKIINEEYGEAIMLARHYGLDCDRVYERQWKLSNLSKIAIKDYLSKIQSLDVVIRECLCTVPSDVDAAEELLQYGLLRVQNTPEMDKNLSMNCQEILNRFLDRLSTYSDILENDEDFAPADFCSLRSGTILDVAKDYAFKGNLRAVEVFVKKYDPELEQHLFEIFECIPEPLDPNPIARLLPGTNGTGSFLNNRARQIVTNGNAGHHALNLLNLAAELNLSPDMRLYHLLSTFEALTVEKQNLKLKFDQLCDMTDLQMLLMLLEDETEVSVDGAIMRLAVPFLDRVEQWSKGKSVDLIGPCILEKSKESFGVAVLILKTLEKHLEETWLARDDILKIGVEMVKGSGVEVSPRDLLSLVDFLMKRFKEYLSLERLAVAISGLDVLRRRKIVLSLNEMQKALKEESSAEELISNLLCLTSKFSSHSVRISYPLHILL